eukprot:Clim_evm60s33 gene=Clim_evmTU60s33
MAESSEEATGRKRKEESSTDPSESNLTKRVKLTGSIPFHRGAFKRAHLKKHSCLLTQCSGILVTCGLGREAKCITELSELLATDAIKPIKKNAEEKAAVKDPEGPPNYTGYIDTGTAGTIFYSLGRCQGTEAINICEAIIEMVRSGTRGIQHIRNLYPVQLTCEAVLRTLVGLTRTNVLPHWVSLKADAKEPTTYAIRWHTANNDAVRTSKGEFIAEVGKLLPEKPHRVDLKAPRHMLYVHIVKAAACVSILAADVDTIKARYNLQGLSQKAASKQ